MLDTSINTYINENNIKIKDYGVVERDFQPSKILHDTQESDTIPVFQVSGATTKSTGNLVSTRDRIYKSLKVESDEEAYEKLLRAVSSPAKLVFKEDPGYYKETEKLLDALPFVKFYEKDGNRYLTAAFFVACHREVCNASIHRIMYINRQTAAVRIVPRHLYRLYTSAVKDKGMLPVTIVLGVHPAVLLGVSTSPRLGVFELEVASRLIGGLRVFPSPLHGNPVPLGAGAIIEGYLLPDRVEEGPFADILMLYDQVRREPVLKVEKVYVSQEHYTHVLLPGGLEHINLMGFPREAHIWESVSKVVPRVYKVRLTRGGGGWLNAVISIEKNHAGDGKNAILAAFAGHPSLKHVIVVDGDIDPDDPSMVEWAIATRFQADRDLIVIKNARGSTLDPSARQGFTAKMGIDATVPEIGDPRFERASFPR
ncbi:MAG: UbiD family decarboxylase [Desulfurococcales archaeon]|nr:UbiD family decarboxylase [Desulfurococcales archaeon]